MLCWRNPSKYWSVTRGNHDKGRATPVPKSDDDMPSPLFVWVFHCVLMCAVLLLDVFAIQHRSDSWLVSFYWIVWGIGWASQAKTMVEPPLVCWQDAFDQASCLIARSDEVLWPVGPWRVFGLLSDSRDSFQGADNWRTLVMSKVLMICGTYYLHLSLLHTVQFAPIFPTCDIWFTKGRCALRVAAEQLLRMEAWKTCHGMVQACKRVRNFAPFTTLLYCPGKTWTCSPLQVVFC